MVEILEGIARNPECTRETELAAVKTLEELERRQVQEREPRQNLFADLDALERQIRAKRN